MAIIYSEFFLGEVHEQKWLCWRLGMRQGIVFRLHIYLAVVRRAAAQATGTYSVLWTLLEWRRGVEWRVS